MNQKQTFESYLVDFEIDGLKGRYWQAPALQPSRDSCLFVMLYGHHASLERNRGLLQYLRRFGRILIIDLPGLGGMDSFYKIGKKPTLDNYAHFLHKFLKEKLPPSAEILPAGFQPGPDGQQPSSDPLSPISATPESFGFSGGFFEGNRLEIQPSAALLLSDSLRAGQNPAGGLLSSATSF